MNTHFNMIWVYPHLRIRHCESEHPGPIENQGNNFLGEHSSCSPRWHTVRTWPMTSTRECSLTKKCQSLPISFENTVNILLQTISGHFGSLDYIKCPFERNDKDPTGFKTNSKSALNLTKAVNPKTKFQDTMGNIPRILETNPQYLEWTSKMQLIWANALTYI